VRRWKIVNGMDDRKISNLRDMKGLAQALSFKEYDSIRADIERK